MLIYAWQSFGFLISYQSDYIKRKRRNSSMSCLLSWNYLDASLTLPKHGRSDDCHQHPPLWPKTPYRHGGGGSRLCSHLLADLCCSISHFLSMLQQLPKYMPAPKTAYAEEKIRSQQGSMQQAAPYSPRAFGIRVCPPHLEVLRKGRSLSLIRFYFLF